MDTTTTLMKSAPLRRTALVLLILSTAVLFVIVYAQIVPVSEDWRVIREGVLALLSGNGYTADYFNPPWTALILAPLAQLPATISSAVLALVNLASFGVVAHRLGAKLPALLLLLTSAPVISGVGIGNIDWLPALGLLLPPRWGLFFVLIKPQVGIGIALYWLWEAWQRGRAREVLRVFAPVTAAFLASFLIYGPYLFRPSLKTEWSTSLFPYLVPVGVVLLVLAVRKRTPHFAVGAGLFFSPYLTFPSYALLVLSGVRRWWLAAAVSALLWAAVAYALVFG
jgi:hypothetical protein